MPVSCGATMVSGKCQPHRHGGGARRRGAPPHGLVRRTAATHDPGRCPAPSARRQTHCAFGARRTGLLHPPHRPGLPPGLRAGRPFAPASAPWTHATAVELKNLIALGVIGSKTKIEKLCYRVDTRIAVASFRHACHGSVFSALRASGPPPAADTDDPGHTACADRPPPPRRCFLRPIRVCVRTAGALVVAVLFFLPGPALPWTT